MALTVDVSDELLADIVDRVRPDILQLHGHEAPSRVADVKRRFGLPVIKAFPVATNSDAEAANDFNEIADLMLFDAKPPKEALVPGGNGVAFDWSALDGVKTKRAFMLSGGLNIGNVAAAIERTAPLAVDVSSGVESAAGIKDVEMIRRFLHAAKTAKHQT